MQGNILLANWKKNKLNGEIFYFQSELKQWFNFEYISGKCVRTVPIEAQNDLDYNFMKNYPEYQNLLEEGLIEYFKKIETKAKNPNLHFIGLIIENEQLL